jgi:hypothetical protein
MTRRSIHVNAERREKSPLVVLRQGVVQSLLHNLGTEYDRNGLSGLIGTHAQVFDVAVN